MKTKYLSQDERELGLKYFFRWATFNGLGFSFLGDTIIYLMAIHFGASNLQLGYISSAIQVSGIMLLIVPRLIAGQKLVQVIFYSWLFRGLICLLYAMLFWFSGQTAVRIILVLYTLFCAIRTVGMSVISPIQQMLSTSSTMGETVVVFSNRFQSSRFLSQLLSFVLLSFKSMTAGIGGYLSLMLMGISTNTIAAFCLKKIPCRETVEYRKGQNIFRILYQSLCNRERALTLIVRWQSLSLMIGLSFIIPFLRKLGNFPPNLIFLFTLTGALAIILAGHALRPFTDRIGSRPVLIVASFLLAALSLIWCVIPPDSPQWYFFLLGFPTIFLQGTLYLLSSRLELRSIPESDKVGYASMLNFFSAIVSLGIGLFAGYLADLGESIPLSGLNPFGLTFFIAVMLSIHIGILSFFLEDAGSLSVRDTAQILFSARNLKAFLNVHQLHLTSDINKRKSILLSISKADAGVAVDEMRKILRNPLSVEKGEILKFLFAYPKSRLLPDLLREAADEYSYHRETAIFALGAYPGKRVEEVLVPLLQHPVPAVRSNAAKSLARVGNISTLPQVNRLAADASLGLTDRMNYLIALSIMDHKGCYLEGIFDITGKTHAGTQEQTMLSLAAKMLDMQPALADLYQEENLQKGAGLDILLEEAKPLKPFFDDTSRLQQYYQRQEYRQIWRWCHEQLALHEIHESKEKLRFLTHAIGQYDVECANADNSLAVLYFSYQILS
ncbi:hypothetical protein CSB45_09360 [candidate division KSB3 bacterium]|uniref:MFS transporter n=1 Tax=candidate division KSB3 bacterium TaxID=2044937 RepID=A0A2G6E458_9BACT|nr:MAG: hypothetical protein CSB45_09360 [candidate division KSB3 bacterium]PIE29467.1 MAG: hypothetical protein CSA57_08715 [candidate division KSB3 bacterium]